MDVSSAQVVENGARAAADTGDLRTVLQVARELESRGAELRLTTLTSLASACTEHAQVLHCRCVNLFGSYAEVVWETRLMGMLLLRRSAACGTSW